MFPLHTFTFVLTFKRYLHPDDAADFHHDVAVQLERFATDKIGHCALHSVVEPRVPRVKVPECPCSLCTSQG